MYSLTSANRYYLYQGFVRMNLGIDGLFKIIRSEMKDLSPVSGDIFLFFGKNSLKLARTSPSQTKLTVAVYSPAPKIVETWGTYFSITPETTSHTFDGTKRPSFPIV